MEIQSLSIVIPTKRCINDCPFCVSKMHDNDYANSGFAIKQIKKRLKYAMNNGVNTVILTGTGEALQNKKFLKNLAELFEELDHPFPNVELQTTGVLLNKQSEVFIDENSGEEVTRYENLDLLNLIGVNTISLSVSNIFDDNRNMELIGTPSHAQFKLKEVIRLLKNFNFNVRLSMNMVKDYNLYNPELIIAQCRILDVQQLTFRKLYMSTANTAEDQWVEENSCHDNLIEHLHDIIKTVGERLYQLPYGPVAYSIYGMSVVIDDDCMGKQNEENLKYLILREDGKLYCRWDNKGSLIF